MPRTFAGFVPPLLAVLALTLSGTAIAGPPEGVSGKMVLLDDPVADVLRKCLREKDRDKRLEMLSKLVPSGDPRVAVALATIAWKQEGPFRRSGDKYRRAAADLLLVNYLHIPFILSDDEAKRCWEEKGEDLRRRAKQLP